MPKTSAGAKTRRRVPGSDLRTTPLSAYAAGLPPGRWEPPAPIVAGVLTVATILRAAARERSAAARRRAIERSAEVASELLTPDQIRFGTMLDPIGLGGPLTAIRTLLVETKAVAPAPDLAVHALESLLAMTPDDSADRGRILSSILSQGFDLGIDGIRLERNRELARLGRRLRDDELSYRAWVHLTVGAFARGNLPQMTVYTRRIMKYARRMGDGRAIASAMAYAGTSAGMNGNPEVSIELLWESFLLADHPHIRLNSLANLAETLLRVGRFRESRAARAATFQMTNTLPHVSVSLGGYAICSASLGDVAGVKWAIAQILRLAGTHAPSRGLAQGLMGCADAAAIAGFHELAQSLFQRSRAIAFAYGFHDLSFRADPTTVVAAPRAVKFGGDAERALESIADLAPDGMPVDSVLVAG